MSSIFLFFSPSNHFKKILDLLNLKNDLCFIIHTQTNYVMPTNTAIPRKKRKTPTVFYKQKLVMKVVEESAELFNAEAVSSANNASKIMRSFFDNDTFGYTESVWALFLNKANVPVCWANISDGGMTGSVVDTRVIFAHGYISGASGLIIAHNHPSGALRPSQSDIDVTRRIKKAGENVEILLLDHIILTSNGYYSFADEGMLY